MSASRRPRNESKRTRQLKREKRRKDAQAQLSEMRSPVLPHLKEGQERNIRWLRSREDPFSQLLARSYKSSFNGVNLVSRGLLKAGDRKQIPVLAAAALSDLGNELDEVMTELRRLAAKCDPIWMLGLSSFLNVYGRWGEYYEPSNEKRETHVEILAAILASQPSGERVDRDGVRFSRINELLAEVERLSWLYNLARTASQLDSDSQHRLELGFRSAQYWMGVRGDCYAAHAVDLAFRVYKRADSWLRSNYGFSGEDLITTALATKDLLQVRVNGALKRVRDDPKSLAALNDLGQELDDENRPATAGQLLEIIRQCEDSVVEALAFSESDLATFGRDRLHDPAALPAVLSRLSIDLSEAPAGTYRGPYDVSPLRDRPLVHFNESYLLPVPGHLLRNLPTLLENTLLQDYPRFSRMRAEVVDDYAIELLMAALPGAKAATRLKYTFDDGEGELDYEVDGLLVFEDCLFILEGKATELSRQAQRGDLKRAVRDLNRAIGEAWRQADRARRFVLESDRAEFRSDVSTMRLQRDSLRTILLINPTFHHLSDFVLQEPALRSLGALPEEIWAWSVYINDLRVVCELVSTPAELIHYIEWRSRLKVGEEILVIDELDIFGSYLFGGFGEKPKKGQVMFMGNSTTDFDAYYAGLAGDGPVREKPHRVLGPYLERELRRMARKRPNGWLRHSEALLDLKLEQAAFVEVALTSWAPQYFSSPRESPMVAERAGVLVVVMGGRDESEQIARPAGHRSGQMFIGARFGSDRSHIVTVEGNKTHD